MTDNNWIFSKLKRSANVRWSKKAEKAVCFTCGKAKVIYRAGARGYCGDHRGEAQEYMRARSAATMRARERRHERLTGEPPVRKW